LTCKEIWILDNGISLCYNCHTNLEKLRASQISFIKSLNIALLLFDEPIIDNQSLDDAVDNLSNDEIFYYRVLG
jgi:hypothetical protein